MPLWFFSGLFFLFLLCTTGAVSTYYFIASAPTYVVLLHFALNFVLFYSSEYKLLQHPFTVILEIRHHLTLVQNKFISNFLMETLQKNHWTVCNVTTLESTQGNNQRWIQRCEPYCCTVTPTWPFVVLSVFSLCKKWIWLNIGESLFVLDKEVDDSSKK